ncbi:MAG: hypothetical protein FJ083_17635, partial [Cyanobacteria bacterium K_Offshore_surface_m2_239]|nr:hypothetical protein [Cyanobacteria bacterium K_Offshore_surface_m2_239]
EPEASSDGVALVAAPLDLLATKLKVLLQRAECKDYADVAVLLASGLTLAEGLAAARALYGAAFPISEALSWSSWRERQRARLAKAKARISEARQGRINSGIWRSGSLAGREARWRWIASCTCSKAALV